MNPIKVNYLNTDYEVEFRQYMDGNTAIYLFGTDDNPEAFMPATTNVGLVNAPSNVIVVDDWNGLAKALNDSGVIGNRIGYARSGYVEYEVYLLEPKALNQLENDFERLELEVLGKAKIN